MALTLPHRTLGTIAMVLATALWLAAPDLSQAQATATSRVYLDEDYDFQVTSPPGWNRYDPAHLSVPGEVCRAWTPDGTTTISIFVQKADAPTHPREILEGSASAMKRIGAMVQEQEVRPVAGMQAMWLVATGDGTGVALTGKGSVRTTQHWVAIPRQHDVLVFLLNTPAADVVAQEAVFAEMLKTLRVGGTQTAEQRAPEPPRAPVAPVNLGFEILAGPHGLSQGWEVAGALPQTGGEGYEAVADREVFHSGKASGRIHLINEKTHTFGTLTQAIAADAFRGKRVRLSGWLRTRDSDFAGLWLRVDPQLAFDNMSDRGVKGTTDWSRFEVVLNVPQEATKLAFGALLAGGGTLWVDDLSLEAVGPDVPVTRVN